MVAFLVFALVVVGVFWFIHQFAVNMIYFDQWADINVIKHAHDGTLSFATVWGRNNENRILFPNLIVLALAYTTHFNVVVEDFLSGIFVVVATALIVIAHKRRSPTLAWILYCPVALVFLSFSPLGTALFGFLISWYLVMVGLAVALFLLDRTSLTWMATAGAVAAAVVGSYSSLQGLFIWPAGLVLLYLRRRDLHTAMVWVGCATVTTVLYFVNFNWAATGGHQSSALSHPWAALRFFFESLGNVTGSRISTTPGSVNGLGPGPGCRHLSAVAAVALIDNSQRSRRWWGPRRRPHLLRAHLRHLHHPRPYPTGALRRITPVRHLRPVRMGGGVSGPVGAGGGGRQPNGEAVGGATTRPAAHRWSHVPPRWPWRPWGLCSVCSSCSSCSGSPTA